MRNTLAENPKMKSNNPRGEVSPTVDAAETNGEGACSTLGVGILGGGHGDGGDLGPVAPLCQEGEGEGLGEGGRREAGDELLAREALRWRTGGGQPGGNTGVRMVYGGGGRPPPFKASFGEAEAA